MHACPCLLATSVTRSKVFGQNFEGLLIIWSIFEPNLLINYAIWQRFIVVKDQN